MVEVTAAGIMAVAGIMAARITGELHTMAADTTEAMWPIMAVMAAATWPTVPRVPTAAITGSPPPVVAATWSLIGAAAA